MESCSRTGNPICWTAGFQPYCRVGQKRLIERVAAIFRVLKYPGKTGLLYTFSAEDSVGRRTPWPGFMLVRSFRSRHSWPTIFSDSLELIENETKYNIYLTMLYKLCRSRIYRLKLINSDTCVNDCWRSPCPAAGIFLAIIKNYIDIYKTPYYRFVRIQFILNGSC